MDIKRIVNSAVAMFASGFALFFTEGIMPIGDWRWLALSAMAMIILLVVNWKEIRAFFRRKPDSVAVDYVQACEIVNGYIDPDRTLQDRVRLGVRTDILNSFEVVLGAKIGENYNGVILHQWMQKNAARMLVQHRGEIR